MVNTERSVLGPVGGTLYRPLQGNCTGMVINWKLFRRFVNYSTAADLQLQL